MLFRPENPLIVQGDGSLLLEVDNERHEDARDFLARFAELEKSPQHIHTYRITSLSLWNAASAGLGAHEVVAGLIEFSKYDLPPRMVDDIHEKVARFGKVVLLPPRPDDPGTLLLDVLEPTVARKVASNKKAIAAMRGAVREGLFRVPLVNRGSIKQILLRMGYPVEDRAGFTDGASLHVHLRQETRSGDKFSLRKYQHQAIAAWSRKGGDDGGHGVVVLPCGAGKTIVGLATMAANQTQTLILATGVSSVRQWIEEILERTNLTEDQVGEYSGTQKQIRPVTVTTYQILTHRKSTESEFTHLGLFSAADWGLIIYDEVHLLPAPVFRITADIQARRRLGLTATLVREDGREADVFSLIGPKRFDVPWRELERRGFVAEAQCIELRVGLSTPLSLAYKNAEARKKIRIAAENPRKLEVVAELLNRHVDDKVLIIGMYLDQLEQVAKLFNAPLITGKTPNPQRDELYGRFRRGEIRVLTVSKVANFSIDLPDANVAIQLSGTFGSRQEEAQRLGRILRPSGGDAVFYSVVTRSSREQEFAHNRQLFLTEQGYNYLIEEWDPAEEEREASQPMFA
ncbi:MAG TPA: helicase [Deltaproteobacteria bacterium]|nr:helicase [Deltaproteobacteria bacterium]HCP47736.1 helicase [Deltaproteobacteria bacterium]